MKKFVLKFLTVALCLIATLSVVACGGQTSQSNSESASESVSITETSSVSTEQTVSDSSTTSSATSSAVQGTRFSMSYKSVISPTTSTPVEPATAETTVFLVGDSTVCEYTAVKEKASYYYMRNGYGMQLGNYLNDKVTIRNLALSGRSSKSFLSETNYTTLKNEIKAGDYLIIGFGHNDEKFEEARYTDPTLGTTEPTSFKYHLYEYYIKVAQEAGAIPILCTPIVRRVAGGTYSGSNIHQTTSNATYAGGDYSKCIIELGQEKNVDVVDLTTLTKNYLTGMAPGESAMLFAWKNPGSELFTTSQSMDNTHINAYGAQVVARLFIEELNATTNNSLRGYIKAELPMPTTDVLVPASQLA